MSKSEDEKEQFARDLKANEDASDKLDKELNKPAVPSVTFNPFAKKGEPDAVITMDIPDDAKIGEIVEGSVSEKEEDEHKGPPQISMKQQILEEHGGLESDVPINSPYWKL